VKPDAAASDSNSTINPSAPRGKPPHNARTSLRFGPTPPDIRAHSKPAAQRVRPPTSGQLIAAVRQQARRTTRVPPSAPGQTPPQPRAPAKPARTTRVRPGVSRQHSRSRARQQAGRTSEYPSASGQPRRRLESKPAAQPADLLPLRANPAAAREQQADRNNPRTSPCFGPTPPQPGARQASPSHRQRPPIRASTIHAG
jgi:hypothetical protein